jgi:hypothetical protein
VLEVGATLTCGPQLAATGRKRKRGRGRCWASSSSRWAARCEDGPREGVGLHGGKRNKKGRKELGRALAYQAGRERGGEERWASGCLRWGCAGCGGPRGDLGQAGPRGEKEKMWVGLEKEKGREKKEGLESFFFLFSYLFKLLNLNPFSNFSRFKLFSKIFKTI